jgi:hypothetical protein
MRPATAGLDSGRVARRLAMHPCPRARPVPKPAVQDYARTLVPALGLLAVLAADVPLMGLAQDGTGDASGTNAWRVALLLALVAFAGRRWLTRRGSRRRWRDEDRYSHHDSYGGHDDGDNSGGDGGD